jgi:hypothetical protein
MLKKAANKTPNKTPNKNPNDAAPVTSDVAPVVERKARTPRTPAYKDLGYCTITECPSTIVHEGVEFRVRRYDVHFADGDERNATRGSMRSALSYACVHNPDRKVRTRREASPYGTLAILRAIKTLRAICGRRDPALCDALNTAVDALDNDLAWQSGTGVVDVAAIEAAENGRVAAVRAARTTAKAE